jgi:23S rRNA (cytosine1962-C5)-methyltransferase
MNELNKLLTTAWLQRSSLQSQWDAEDTTCYRIFHGTNEGLPGTTLDRYGPLLILQSFHQTLTDEQFATFEAFSSTNFDGLHLVYNDRSPNNSRIQSSDTHAEDTTPYVAKELGISYRVQGRHQGQDPWLFLDMRAGRRYVKENSKNKSVLNLFSYTCGIGIAAGVGGASSVLNIDFAKSSLAIGQDNAKLNQLDQIQFVQSDAFPAIKQLAGIPVAGRRSQRLPHYPKLSKQQFDLVFLDPPRWAKSPFGNVDLVRDYQSLFKPSLMATADGGQLICCNNVAQVDRDEWIELLKRCAIKAGRPLKSIDILLPDNDFPSPDNNPPLKMAICQL